MTDKNSAVRSISEFGRIAAATPSGTAVSSAKEMPQTPSVIVTDSRSAMRSATGSLK